MSKRERRIRVWIAWSLVLASVAVFLWTQWMLRDSLEDDTYITFRYARNLADGHGLVFNPGERVEGITNLLWALVLAGAYRLGGGFEMPAMILSATCGLLLIILLSRSRIPLRPNTGEVAWMPLAGFLLALNPAFQAEAAMGLETVVFTLLVFMAFESTVAEIRGVNALPLSGLYLALAAWTRPEGLWIIGYVLVFRAVRRWIFRCDDPPLPAAAALSLAAVAALFAIRYGYYGEWLPNTFYAKTGAGIRQWDRGFGYLKHFFHAFGYVSVFVPALYLAVRKRFRWEHALTGGFVILYFAYVVHVGGDYKPSHRFLIHVLPFLYLFWLDACAALISGLAPRMGYLRTNPFNRYMALSLLAGVYLAVSLPRYADVYEFMEASHQKIQLDRLAAVWIAENTPPETTLATEVIGRIPYYTGRITYDLSGLTDKHIARLVPEHLGSGPAGHEKTDAGYIIARKPDIVLFHSVLFTNHPDPALQGRQVNYFESELWQVRDFRLNYRLRSVVLIPDRLYFNFFQRIPLEF